MPQKIRSKRQRKKSFSQAFVNYLLSLNGSELRRQINGFLERADERLSSPPAEIRFILKQIHQERIVPPKDKKIISLPNAPISQTNTKGQQVRLLTPYDPILDLLM